MLQVGTYEWYIKDQSLDNIFVHFKAAVSPDKRVTASAADVRYNLLFESRNDGWQLTLKTQETGEVLNRKIPLFLFVILQNPDSFIFEYFNSILFVHYCIHSVLK